MRAKSGFKNMPKMQAKKFAQLRRERIWQRVVKALRRLVGRNAT